MAVHGKLLRESLKSGAGSYLGGRGDLYEEFGEAVYRIGKNYERQYARNNDMYLMNESPRSASYSKKMLAMKDRVDRHDD